MRLYRCSEQQQRHSLDKQQKQTKIGARLLGHGRENHKLHAINPKNTCVIRFEFIVPPRKCLLLPCNWQAVLIEGECITVI